jgi:hypothetical protein
MNHVAHILISFFFFSVSMFKILQNFYDSIGFSYSLAYIYILFVPEIWSCKKNF